MEATVCPVCKYDEHSLEMKNEHGSYYSCNLCGHNWLDASAPALPEKVRTLQKRTIKIKELFNRPAAHHSHR